MSDSVFFSPKALGMLGRCNGSAMTFKPLCEAMMRPVAQRLIPVRY
jgi:hypothetical protein